MQDIRTAEFEVRQAQEAALARSKAKTRLGRARAVLRDKAYQKARTALDAVWRASAGVNPYD